jgi:hypothetical protein
LYKPDDKSQSKDKSKGKNDKGAKDSKPNDKKFNVNLSSADRIFFGEPRGNRTAGNPEGWSKGQRHSINAVIASDQSRHTNPRVDRNVPYQRSEHEFDQSPDQLYEQYAHSYHHQPSASSTSRPRNDSSTAPAFSHYFNSPRVISKGDIDDSDVETADA